MEEEKLNNTQRDYDKDPIIIEDYNPQIIFYVISILFILFEVFWILNPLEIDYVKIIGAMIATPIVFIPIYNAYNEIKGKHFILKNETISVIYTTKTDIYNISDIKKLKRSFQSYYDVNQKVLGWKKVAWYLIFIVMFPIYIGNEVLNYLFRKYYFNEIDDDYNSLIIYFKEGQFINIAIKNKDIYSQVNQYLIRILGQDIKNIDKQFIYYFYQYNIISKGE